MPGLRIRIDQGELEGCKKITDDGLEYCCYNGIPYAKPPLGELRFRDPQDPEPWDGVRDATNEGSSCPQVDMLAKDVIGSEDCLFINVNVPSASSETSKLPVMVFIHGGGFRSGSGNSATQGPDYFMKHDVIFVTFNYRVGPLGFLCLNNSDVPGNAGLKDQVLALKWIKKNIEKFGGDSESVTIFGESAGAASVHYLMLSPMAKGLFNSAIMQSGCCINNWALQQNPVLNVLELAKNVGFDTKNKEKALEYLREAKFKDVVMAAHSEFSIPDPFKYLPVIESKIANVESFLNRNPKNLMRSGDYNKVPCIIGWNSCEGAVYLSNFFVKIKDFNTVRNWAQLKVDFKALIKEMSMTKNDSEIDKLCLRIKEYYFKIGKTFVEGYIDMITDIHFAISSELSASLMSVHSPVYMYVFSYNGEHNFGKSVNDYEYKGASHGDDLGFLFKINMNGASVLTFNSEEQQVSDRLVTLWTNFAKFQDPTPVYSGLITEKWAPLTSNENNILQIDSGMQMVPNPFTERIQFWKNLLVQKETFKQSFRSKMDFWSNIQKP